MSPKPDVSVERKQQIYEAAITCFSQKGYHLTTMDDIAAAADLSKGSLYWYFKGKKELFLSLFEEMMAPFEQLWAGIVADETSSATDKLLNSLGLFSGVMDEFIRYFGVMMEAWAQTRHDEEVLRLMREFYRPYLAIMTQIIEQGVASGEFQAAAPEATAFAIMNLFDGITLALGMEVADVDGRQLIDAARDLVLYGLGVERTDG